MSKRYLGGDIYFEQKATSQEFSEESSGGSSALSGLTDVDISNPTDGQTLVYNAESGKWENGNGGGDIFESLGTISAATVPMSYDSEQNLWMGTVVTALELKPSTAVRNFHVTLDGIDYTFPAFADGAAVDVDEHTQLYVGITPGSDPVQIMIVVMHEDMQAHEEPIVTNASGEYYTVCEELAVLSGGK